MPTPKWFGPTNALVLAPNSGKLTLSDRSRLVDIYRGNLPLCYASQLARGTFGTGIRGQFVVNQSSVEVERGQIGTLTIEWEAGGAGANLPLPIGDFKLEPQELYPKVERAAVFAGILPQTIRGVQSALNLAERPDGLTSTVNILNYAVGMVPTSGGPPTVWPAPTSAQAAQLTLANNLLSKWTRGEETFYLAGWRYSYEQFSYTEPATSRGAYIGTPGGPLANLPANVSWLRLADNLETAGVNGSMYKNTITWLGGPAFGGIGWWDSDIYM